MGLEYELRELDREILSIPLPYRLAVLVVGIGTLSYFCCADRLGLSSERDGGDISEIFKEKEERRIS
ncbi:MAG: hypothetical protein Q8R18_06385 [bacterium]|nr:hypothetical protein [bacterium]